MTKLNTLPLIVALRKRYGGRLSRTGFFLLSPIAVVILVGIILGLTAIFGTNTFAELSQRSPRSFVVKTILGLSAVAYVGFTTYLRVRRLHDFNVSGWWSLIPLVSLLWSSTFYYVDVALFLVFLLIPGTKDLNRYGNRATKERLEGIPTYYGKPPF